MKEPGIPSCWRRKFRALSLSLIILISFIYYLLICTTDNQLLMREQFNVSSMFYKEDMTIVHSQVKVESRDMVYSDEWLNLTKPEIYGFYGDGTCVNRNRQIFQTIMRKWKELAEQHNIEYFLTDGSLLGAWRNEDIMPWDADLDLRMRLEDFEKIAILAEPEPLNVTDGKFHIYFTKDWRKPYQKRRRLDCFGKSLKKYNGECSFLDPFARLIYKKRHLDLYAYVTYFDTMKFIPFGGEYLKGDVFPLVRCMFMDLEFWCPRNARNVLEQIYKKKIIPNALCKNKMIYGNRLAFMDPGKLQILIKNGRAEMYLKYFKRKNDTNKRI